MNTGDAIAALVVGLVFAVWCAWQLRSGKSYLSTPPAAVTRRGDPFSFWVSVIPAMAIAAALIAVGLFGIFSRM